MNFPSASDLKEWAKLLQEADLDEFLPVITLRWAEQIAGCIEVAKLHPDRDDLNLIASRLFHKIIKNHPVIDGNKRSAVITVCLLYVMNGRRLNIPFGIFYELARLVASDSAHPEQIVLKIHPIFSEYNESIK